MADLDKEGKPAGDMEHCLPAIPSTGGDWETLRQENLQIDVPGIGMGLSKTETP